MKKRGIEITVGDTINLHGLWLKIESISGQNEREVFFEYKESGEIKTASFRKNVVYKIKN